METGAEREAAEARVRIYAVRDPLEPAETGPVSAAEEALSGTSPRARRLRTAVVRQAALADAAARAGMDLTFEAEAGPEGVFLSATGGLERARRCLLDLYRMGFSGYMAETDDGRAEDLISRYHLAVVCDVALLSGARI